MAAETSPPAAPPAGPPPASELNERIGLVETALREVRDMLARLTTGAHADAADTTGQRLEAGTTIADEVQRELARKEEAKLEEERRAALGQLQADVAALKEKPPAPMPRKVERLMGYHG